MGEINIIELILLVLATFVFAIDQFSLTEVLYRPMIACPIIGLIFGDLQTGLVVGGTYELMMVGNMPVGGAQPPNAVLGGVVSMVFACKAGMGVNEALGASIIFSVFGGYVVTLTFTAMSVLMVKADKAADEANPKGIRNINFMSMAMLGTLFAALAALAYVSGAQIEPALKSIQENASWFIAGLGVAGGMLRFVGFAILMKIMLSNDMWGFFFAGFTAAIILGNIEATAKAALVLVAFVGLAIALYDYQTNVKIKNNAGTGAGGATDGI